MPNEKHTAKVALDAHKGDKTAAEIISIHQVSSGQISTWKKCLAEGLRKSNVTHLEWSQIDMERRTAWVKAEDSKSGKAISIPLSDNAMQVLKEYMLVRNEVGIHIKRVFT